MTMTYAQALDVAINAVSDNEVKDRLEALKAQLAKRSSSKTPTKTQKENEVIMTNMLAALSDIGEPVTVTDLLAHGVEGFEITNQKASALLRKLVEGGKVVKTIEGKKAKFALV